MDTLRNALWQTGFTRFSSSHRSNWQQLYIPYYMVHGPRGQQWVAIIAKNRIIIIETLTTTTTATIPLKAMSHLPAIYFGFGVSFAFACLLQLFLNFGFLFIFYTKFLIICVFFLCGSHLATSRRNSTETTRHVLFQISFNRCCRRRIASSNSCCWCC